MIALFVLLAFAPGVFWLWVFLRMDKVRPAPKRLIALSFILGMIATVPAAAIEAFALPRDLLSPDVSLTALAAGMLLVVGPVEETSKFLMVRFGAFQSSYFQEPVDGLVHSTAAALGFASLENLVYILQFGPAVMLARAPLSTVAHLTFGSLWGHGLAVHQRSGRERPGAVFAGLAAAAVLHGLFNIAAFSGTYWWVSVGIVVLGGVWAYRQFEWGQRISPFRLRRNYPLIDCPNCGNEVRIIATYCPHCGHELDEDYVALICGNCRRRNRPDALYCVRCGDRFLVEEQ